MVDIKDAKFGSWQPISTAKEGVHVLLWFPTGERGLGGIECGTLYFNDANAPGGINIWTHGGPNAGSDWQMDEPPTHWMPLPDPPNAQMTGPKAHWHTDLGMLNQSPT